MVHPPAPILLTQMWKQYPKIDSHFQRFIHFSSIFEISQSFKPSIPFAIFIQSLSYLTHLPIVYDPIISSVFLRKEKAIVVFIYFYFLKEISQVIILINKCCNHSSIRKFTTSKGTQCYQCLFFCFESYKNLKKSEYVS
jgi:hypothetical protein